MSDQELLEMAAKAVGIEGDYSPRANAIVSEDGYWSPLDDDGDALWLACSLCMTISTGPCQASASTIEGALRGFFPRENTIQQCQRVAVRRAIVRSAAEIGENKP